MANINHRSNWLFFFYIIQASLFAQHSPELIPCRSGDRWGYADINGNMVVPVQFEEAYPFIRQPEMLSPNFNSEYQETTWPDLESPIAVVKKNNLWGIIGAKGQMLAPPVSVEIFQFEPASKGTFWVRYTGGSKNQDGYDIWKTALLYSGGAKLTPFDYEYILDEYGDDGGEGRGGYFSFAPAEASDNLVVKRNHKAGLLSITGKEVLAPVWWDEIIPGRDDFAVVRSYSGTVALEGYSDESYYLIAPGNRIIKKIQNADYCSGYAGQGLWALAKDGKIWLINNKGERITPGFFSEFIGFNKDGFAEARDSSGQWSIINTKCEKVRTLDYEGQYTKYLDGYWKQESDKLWYPFDRNFQAVGNTGYLSLPTEILLCGKKYWTFQSGDSLWRVKDYPEIHHAFDFNLLGTLSNLSDEWGRKLDSPTLSITKNGKMGIADCLLQVIIPPKFDYCSPIYGPNFWRVSEAGKVGLFDISKKQLILPVKFDEIKAYPQGEKIIFAVREGKYWGQFDHAGKETHPVIFEDNICDIPNTKLVKSKKGWHIFDESPKEISSFTLPVCDTNTTPSLSMYHLAGNDMLGIQLRTNGKAGLYNQWGQMLIPPDYDNFRIQEDYIIAQKAGKCGVLLYPELCEFISFKYEYIGLADDIFILQKHRKDKEYLYYDPKSHKKTSVDPSKYSLNGWFKEGLVVAVKDCNWGYLDERFNEVIPLRYRQAQDFSEGLAAVKYTNKLWGYIDKAGQEVIKPKYIEAESFHQGKSIVRFHHLPDSAIWSSVIDRNERALITAPGLERLGQFIIVAKNDQTFSVLDSNLQTVLDHCYILYREEIEGYLFYLKDGLPGLLWKDGSIRSAEYKLHRFVYPDGRVGVTFLSAWGLQDVNGRWLIPLMPQWARADGNGENFIVSRGENYSLFDRNGNQVIPFQSSSLQLKGNFCETNSDGLLGLYDLKGKLIVPPRFSEIEVLPKLQLIKVITPAQKVGFFDLKGRQYFED